MGFVTHPTANRATGFSTVEGLCPTVYTHLYVLNSILVLHSCRRRSFEPSKEPKMAGCVGGLTLDLVAVAGKRTTRVDILVAALKPSGY